MKTFQLLLILAMTVGLTLLAKNYFEPIPPIEDNPYKERYGLVQDSLREERGRYYDLLKGYQSAEDSLVLVIDSLKKVNVDISRDYDRRIAALDSTSNEEVVDIFNQIAVVDSLPDSDSTIISIGQIRTSVALFYDRNRLQELNTNLVQGIDKYSELSWTYKEMAEISQKESDNYKEAFETADWYAGTLEDAVYYRNKEIRKLKNTNKFVIGAAVAVVTTILILK